MEIEDRQVAMRETGDRRLVVLPRDPERAYVYWEWPPDEIGGDSGTLSVFVNHGEDDRRKVSATPVDRRIDGRFVAFGRPGAVHRCRLEWNGRTEWSRPIRAPRREPGEESPGFVAVRWTDDGLRTEPVEHDHPVHGTFGAPRWSAPSSRLESDDQ